MSFDPIANGWRKLLKSGGVGYANVTEHKVTFNGWDAGYKYIDGALFEMPGVKFLKMQIDPKKVSKIKSMTGGVTDNESYFTKTTYTEEQLNITNEGGVIFLCSSTDGLYHVIIFKEDFTMEDTTFGAGVYFMYVYIEDLGQKNFISEFVYEEETVHTIDPKYISGVTLPVVTLSVDTIMAAYTNEELTALVNEREAAELRKAKDCGLPFVVITETAEGIVEYVSSCIACPDGTGVFMGELLGAKCEIGISDDGCPDIRFIPNNPE